MEKNKKTHNLGKWLKEECTDWKTLVVFLCVVAVVYMPVWGGYLLYYMFKWNWCLAMASITFTFWVGPFTPFFPICIAITLFLKKIMEQKNIKYKEQ